MTKLARKIVCVMACLIFSAMTAGCATLDQKVTLLYQPVVKAAHGTGEVYLATAKGDAWEGKPGAIQWVVGKVKEDSSGEVGEIVTPVAPGDLVLDAFNQELTAAGYRIIQVSALPPGVTKGIVITGTTLDLEEVSSIIKAEGSSRLIFSLELWKNGKKFKKSNYESRTSDFAIKDRDLLLPAILQNSLQDLMKQAVPDLIKELGS
jgi:hypothetical protein